ncbi:MAG: DUF2318 domain-containing protein [Ignavibacteriales bacterium]|nr:DUF2318 domain-containing protein [Ignavibacteriales bacterium]
MQRQCQRCGSKSDESVKFCPQCGSNLQSSSSEAVDQEQTTLARSKWLMRGLLLAVLAVGLFAYVRDAFRTYHPVIEKQPALMQSIATASEKIASKNVPARIEGPFLVVSLKELSEHRLIRFFDPQRIQNIPAIAYLTPDGKLVTAMSISENCRSTDFYLEGENIHCASCPSYWNMTSLEAYACCQKYYPDPIPSTILGDEIRIELQTVRNWKTRS